MKISNNGRILFQQWKVESLDKCAEKGQISYIMSKYEVITLGKIYFKFKLYFKR